MLVAKDTQPLTQKPTWWQSRTGNQKLAMGFIGILTCAGIAFGVLASQHLLSCEKICDSYNNFVAKSSTHNALVFAEAAAVSLLIFTAFWGFCHRNDEGKFWESRTKKQIALIALVSLVSIALISYSFSMMHHIDPFYTESLKHFSWALATPLHTFYGVALPTAILSSFIINGLYGGFFYKKGQEKIPGGLHLLTLPISTYVTEGLAKIFDLQVLRHGTSGKGYLGILRKGADPSCGGTGSCENEILAEGQSSFVDKCRDKFHVFKDSESILDDGDFVSPTIGQIIKRTHPRILHTVSTGAGLANGIPWRVLRYPVKFISGILHFFGCPAIRFVYRQEEIDKTFENDPDYHGMAYRTNQALPNTRIGLIGTLTQIETSDFKRAWNKNPVRVLGGVVQLVGGVALTLLGLGLVL